MPKETLTYYYGSYTVDNGVYYPHLGLSPWWCTELAQLTNPYATISLSGEILPDSVVGIVEDQSPIMDLWVNMPVYGIDPGYGVLRNYEIWNYLNTNPSLVIGKTPLWSQVIPQRQADITITLAVTNIGYRDCNWAMVTDVIPAGYSYHAANPMPAEIINPDGSITLIWEIDLDAAVATVDHTLPNEYQTEWITYTLTTPELGSGTSVFLPSANVDFEDGVGEDAHSAQPLIEVQYLIEEGDCVQFDWSGHDSSSINFSWDLDDDGQFNDAFGPTTINTWFDDGSYDVSLEARNLDLGISDTDTMNIQVVNVPPSVKIDPEIQVVQLNIVELSLRVTGSKWSNFGMTLYEDDDIIGYIEVERWPGNPDDNPICGDSTLSVQIDETKSYRAIVTYDPYPDSNDEIKGDQPNNGKDKKNNAGNPVWIDIKTENGTTTTVHHTFNTQQIKIRNSEHENHVEPWEVELDTYFEGIQGVSIDLEATAYDPGADELSFIWEFDDGTILIHDYPNDGGTYPVSVTDTVNYVGSASGVILTVMDDDGGIGTEILIL
ncbi:MAG: hypothetical protein JSV09_03240 [Thermoplasmata archaeon]|nr:MAG: hypothetical protein JSV09_03240 [Thermoplasmata archaeon]